MIDIANFSQTLDNFHWLNYNKPTNGNLIKGQQDFIINVRYVASDLADILDNLERPLDNVYKSAQFILDAYYVYESDYEHCFKRNYKVKLLKPDVILNLAVKPFITRLPLLYFNKNDNILSILTDLAKPNNKDSKYYYFSQHNRISLQDLFKMFDYLTNVDQQLGNTLNELNDSKDENVKNKIIDVRYNIAFCLAILLQYIK